MVIRKHPSHEERLSYQHKLGQGRVLFVGAVTDTGPKRTGNEDNILAQGNLFAVADGMGGHEAGEIASALAVTHIKTNKDSSQSLAEIVKAANTTIFDHGQAYPQHQGLGTTVVALRFKYDGTAEYAYVGDSRLYQLNIYDSAKRIRPVTRDHSLVQQMFDHRL